MSINLIGINGRIGSGKDTVTKLIQTALLDENWENKKFAKKLKLVASILTGIRESYMEDQYAKANCFYNISTGDQLWRRNLPENAVIIEEVKESYPENAWISLRVFLQDLGTNAVRSRWDMIWVNALFDDFIKEDVYKVSFHSILVQKPSHWIISDTRFENEAQAIKDRGGVVIRVNRVLPDDKISPKDLHPSETALDNWDFDYVIDNSRTLQDLGEAVKKMLNHFKLL